MGNTCKKPQSSQSLAQVNFFPPEQPATDPTEHPRKSDSPQIELQGKTGPLAEAVKRTLSNSVTYRPGEQKALQSIQAAPIAGGVMPPMVGISNKSIPETPKEDEDGFDLEPLKGQNFAIPESCREVDVDKGKKYTGQWENGVQHGVGKLKFPDGSSYTGHFDNGKATGLGIYRAKNGSTYEGEFKDGIASGYGKYTFPDGSLYWGTFADDKRSGRGKEVQHQGPVYVGNFKEGMKHGMGELRVAPGESYVGNWDKGLFDGEGTYVWADGRRYKGNWVRGFQEGHGTFEWPDGRRFCGQYVQGKMQGEGTLEWPDGRKYAGNWVENSQHGKGKFYKDPTHYRLGFFNRGNLLRFLEEDWQEEPNASEPNALAERIKDEQERLARLDATNISGPRDDQGIQGMDEFFSASKPKPRTESAHPGL